MGAAIRLAGASFGFTLSDVSANARAVANADADAETVGDHGSVDATGTGEGIATTFDAGCGVDVNADGVSSSDLELEFLCGAGSESDAGARGQWSTSRRDEFWRRGFDAKVADSAARTAIVANVATGVIDEPQRAQADADADAGAVANVRDESGIVADTTAIRGANKAVSCGHADGGTVASRVGEARRRGHGSAREEEVARTIGFVATESGVGLPDLGQGASSRSEGRGGSSGARAFST